MNLIPVKEIGELNMLFGEKMGSLERLEDFVKCNYNLTLRVAGSSKLLIEDNIPAVINLIGIETYTEWYKTYTEMKAMEEKLKYLITKYEKENPDKKIVLVTVDGYPVLGAMLKSDLEV